MWAAEGSKGPWWNRIGSASSERFEGLRTPSQPQLGPRLMGPVPTGGCDKAARGRRMAKPSGTLARHS